MNGGRPVVPVERVAETGSTNADLLAAARGEPADLPFTPRARVADRQTAGRGRQGRAWHAATGASLTFSLAWPLPAIDLSGLSLAIGLALAEALDPRPAEPLRIGLKWPNDLWLIGPREAGRKLAGILVETVPHGAGRIVVVGVGINLREQAVAGASTGVAWLGEIDPSLEREAVLACAIDALVDAMTRFEEEGFAAMVERYAARDLLQGRAVVARGREGELAGQACGISPTGELLLRDANGRVHRIGSGEVSIRLAEPEPERELGAKPAVSPC